MELLKTLGTLLLAALIATLLGAGGTWLALGRTDLGRTGGGGAGWREVLGDGAPDPYRPLAERAVFALPLGPKEGTAFEAAASDDGEQLSAACAYRIEGRLPPTHFWTLVASGEGSASGLQSLQSLREADGRVVLVASRRPAPGNWLRLPMRGAFRLTFSLYGMPAAGVTASQAVLPSIVRTGCDE